MLQIRKNITNGIGCYALAVKPVLLFLLYSFALTSIVNTQWRFAPGSEGVLIEDIDIFYGNNDTMYASGGQFLKSVDNGEHWNNISSAFWGGQIKIDAYDANVIFLNRENTRTWGTESWKTHDGGIEWTNIFSTQAYFPSYFVERDPMDLNVLYMNNGDYIIRSTDRGNIWHEVITPEIYSLNSFAISPGNNQILFYVDALGIFKSTNYGLNWMRLPLNFSIEYTATIAVDPKNSDVIYFVLFSWTGAPGGIYKSTDGGFSWHEKNNGLSSDDRDIKVITINPKNTNELYIGAWSLQNHIFFKSEDSGENWLPFYMGLPDSGEVSSCIIDTTNDKIFISVGAHNTSSIFIRDINTNIDDAQISTNNFYLNIYPNPFNSETILSYRLSNTNFVTIEVFDINGKKIQVLKNEIVHPGNYTTKFSADYLPSGIYFVRLQTKTTNGQQFTATKKMLLTK